MSLAGGAGHCVIYKKAGPTVGTVGGASYRHVTASRFRHACFRKPSFLGQQQVPHQQALCLSRQPRAGRQMGTITAGALPLAAVAAGAALGGLVGLAVWDARRLSRRPEVIAQKTPFNLAVLSRCPTIDSVYEVPPFLSNGHVETILASKLRRDPRREYVRELLAMADGGTVALDYEDLESSKALPADAPVLIVLPGLTGGSHDTYVQHMVGTAHRHGIRAVIFNSRGTSDGPVTTPQFYSASFTGDMREVVRVVAKKFPRSPLLAAGYSLGANILVRYLGEEGARTPIVAAVSMCNPFDLVISDNNFHVGFNRVYDVNLANSLRRIYARHEHLFQGLGGEYNPTLAANCKTIREFDDAITRVSFGWPSVDAYYAGSGSAASVPNVAIPLLYIQAEDDPIAPKNAIPYAALEANPSCILVTTPAGGHLGWCAGSEGPFEAPWCNLPTVEFLNSALLELYRTGIVPSGSTGRVSETESTDGSSDIKDAGPPAPVQATRDATYSKNGSNGTGKGRTEVALTQ